MITNQRTRRFTGRVAVVAATALLLATAGGPTAVARPDPGDYNAAKPAPTELTYELRRIGTEYVRGDLLTGEGVLAPSWVPGWGTRIAQ